MKFKKSIWLALFLIIAVTSCKKPEDTTNPTPQPTEQALGFVVASSAELAGSELVPELLMGTLPTSFSLNTPPPGNQGEQGSCTSWSTGYAAMSYFMNKVNGTNYGTNQYLCSPKYIYNQITQGNCSGTSYPSNFNILQNKGICTLTDMPYNSNDCSIQPNTAQNTSANNNKILKWERVDKNNITNIKTILYSGSPVLIAITVDASFDNLQTPYIWSAKSGASRGNHAIAVVGYDDNKNAFKVQNSWGSNWKDNGYLWINYNFFPTAVISTECYVIYPIITKVTDNLNSGLVLNIPINGNANDVSGNNNNGNVSNGILVSDRKGISNSAYQFNGFNNIGYLTVPSSGSLNFSSSFSISMWMKINSSAGTDITGTLPADGLTQSSIQSILFKGLNGNSIYINANHQQQGATGSEGTGIQFGYSTFGIASSLSKSIGVWGHIVYTYSNNQLKMYKNGSLIWNKNLFFDVTAGNNQPLYIGKSYQPQYNTNGKPMNGAVDEIRIYNRALDESEVQKLYKL